MLSFLTWSLVGVPPVVLVALAIKRRQQRYWRHIGGFCAGVITSHAVTRVYRVMVLADIDPKFLSSRDAAVELALIDAALTSSASAVTFAVTLWGSSKISLKATSVEERMRLDAGFSAFAGVACGVFVPLTLPTPYLLWFFLYAVMYALVLVVVQKCER